MPLGGALTLALVGAAATKYSSDSQKGAQSRAAGIANTGKMGNTAFTPTAAKAGETLKDVLGGGKRDFSAPISQPEMIDSGVGKSGMGDAPAQGARLKEALANDTPGPSAVEGLDAGPEKFAQMNNPAMGAGPKAASSPSWLNADTIGTAAQVAGALASSGGGPPSAGLPNVGNMNYTPTVTRLQQALGRSPQRF
jgi:hypothetical protein